LFIKVLLGFLYLGVGCFQPGWWLGLSRSDLPWTTAVELPGFLGCDERFEVTLLNDPGIQPSGSGQVSFMKVILDGRVG
jgi:hypothetical protein